MGPPAPRAALTPLATWSAVPIGDTMLTGYKTYIGIALTALIGVAAILGIQPAADTPQWLDAILMILTSIYAAYGRRDKERRSVDVSA